MEQSKKKEMRDAVRRVAMSFELEDILRRYKKRGKEPVSQDKAFNKLNELLSLEMDSHTVNVRGNDQTNSQFIIDELNLRTPNTISNCSSQVLNGLARLENDLGIFESVAAEIDIDSDNERQLNVDLNIKEKQRLIAHIGASHEPGNGQSVSPINGDMSVGIRNIFGRGESLEISSNVGLSGRNGPFPSMFSSSNGSNVDNNNNDNINAGTTRSFQNIVDNTSLEYSIIFKKPRLELPINLFPFISEEDTLTSTDPSNPSIMNLNPINKPYLNIKGFREHIDRSESSSYHKETVGGTVGILSPNLEHCYQFKYHLRSTVIDTRKNNTENGRNNNGTTDAMSGSMSDYQFPSLKSSLEYTFIRDKRDHMSLPSKGYQAFGNIEFAGLGADVDFFKILGRFQQHFKLNNNFVTDTIGNCVLNLGFESGFVIPWKKALFKFNNGDASIRQIDRIIPLGGLQMRGFQFGQLGPKEGKDYVHSDFLLNAGVSLTFPLIPSYFVYANLFLNTIYCELLDDLSIEKIQTHTKISGGISLCIPTPVCRIEAGYAFPIQNNRNDPFSRFFINFGTSFF